MSKKAILATPMHNFAAEAVHVRTPDLRATVRVIEYSAKRYRVYWPGTMGAVYAFDSVTGESATARVPWRLTIASVDSLRVELARIRATEHAGAGV